MTAGSSAAVRACPTPTNVAAAISASRISRRGMWVSMLALRCGNRNVPVGAGQPHRRESLCRLVRRDPLLVCLLVQARQRVGDPGHLALELLRIPAELLEPDPVQRAA